MAQPCDYQKTGRMKTKDEDNTIYNIFQQLYLFTDEWQKILNGIYTSSNP